MAKPNYIYDNDTFYQMVQDSADRKILFLNNIIAADLDLDATVFSTMKSECYSQ